MMFVYAVTIVFIVIVTVSLFLMGSNIVDAFALPHAMSIVADFEGKFDNKSINTSGKYRISNDVNIFVLVGNFEETGVSHYDPTTGKYVISNPNCSNITGELVLESVEAKIYLDYTGKNCHYGLLSYVIGTFEVTNSEGKYEILEGEGRITFVADHHNNDVSGQLKGSFN